MTRVPSSGGDRLRRLGLAVAIAVPLLGIGFVIGRITGGRPAPVVDRSPELDVREVPEPAPLSVQRPSIDPAPVDDSIPADFKVIGAKHTDFKLTDATTIDGRRFWRWSNALGAVLAMTGTDEQHIHAYRAEFAGGSPLRNQMFAIDYGTAVFSDSTGISRLIGNELQRHPRLPMTITVGLTRFTYTVEHGASIVSAASISAAQKPDRDIGNEPLLPLDFAPLRKNHRFFLYNTEDSAGVGRSWIWNRESPGIMITTFGSDDSHLTACEVSANSPPEAKQGGDDMLIAIYYVAKMSDQTSLGSALRRFWNAGPHLPAIHESHGIRAKFSLEGGSSKILCVPIP